MGTTIKPEIQGLRAYAVVAVLLFHVWPQYMPGGYVGVDVFFVISGYLITGLLLRELENTNRIKVLGFYGKRLRRLLPAATLVLLATVVSLPLLPAVRWGGVLNEIVASALYVENWWLAFEAVDYLKHGDAVSPVQHYWSLSIEEQFYILWPLLLLGTASIARRFSLPMRLTLGILTSFLLAASLAASMVLTLEQPARAYFVTHTRIWELALGGLAAILMVHRNFVPQTRRWLCAIGLTLIGVSLFAFDQSTMFPGYAALLPTLGSVLVIVLDGDRSARWISASIGSRLARYLGDISYSLYLWHWPILVVFSAQAGRGPGVGEGLGIIAVTLLLAHLTKVYVEDRFRTGSSESRLMHRPLVFGAGCVALSLITAFGVSQYADRSVAGTMKSETAVPDGVSHPGAIVLTSNAPTPQGVGILPEVLTASTDRADAYSQGCITLYGSDEPLLCRYGSVESVRRVVVAGDSHAIQWLPAFQQIAKLQHWELIGITKTSCPFADVTVMLNSVPFEECRRWNDKAYAKILELKPDLVVVTQSQYDTNGFRRGSLESRVALVEGLRRRWNALAAAGIPLVVLRDTPKPGINVPECMTMANASVASCTQQRSVAFNYPDPLLIAIQEVQGAKLIDMSDGICAATECAPVVGNVLVWMDANHLTSTYSRSLAKPLSQKLADIGELQ